MSDIVSETTSWIKSWFFIVFCAFMVLRSGHARITYRTIAACITCFRSSLTAFKYFRRINSHLNPNGLDSDSLGSSLV
ncbi:hypothetical protein EDD16DRAFT_1566671 [Pisolithus croceorrhizus]|nr:hypothetical protein EDD16DRAFT_1566671 [Pisolithus croceorrhizus]